MAGQERSPFRVGRHGGAWLLIPDISGFTDFVKSSNLEHSQFMISALLQTIVAANRTGLELAQVEGDALLFYRLGPAPSLAEVLGQARRMFLHFHGLLEAIQRHAVCDCAACAATVGLTLKFVSHYGEIREIGMDRFRLLVGRDVILAHRLLKNGVRTREYLLLTDSSLASQPEGHALEEGWVRLEPHVEPVAEFGDIPTGVVKLAELREQVRVPPGLDRMVRDTMQTALSRRKSLAL